MTNELEIESDKFPKLTANLNKGDEVTLIVTGRVKDTMDSGTQRNQENTPPQTSLDLSRRHHHDLTTTPPQSDT